MEYPILSPLPCGGIWEPWRPPSSFDSSFRVIAQILSATLVGIDAVPIVIQVALGGGIQPTHTTSRYPV